MHDEAKKIIELLDLKPLTMEGGYFRETYRATEQVQQRHLPARYQGARAFSTAIYYLLTPETHSRLHKVLSDEVFHFYAGDPVELLQLPDAGAGSIVRLGNDIENGDTPQLIVRRNTWQGARLAPGGRYALLGTTVAPGFEYEDFITPDQAMLFAQHPQFAELIEALI